MREPTPLPAPRIPHEFGTKGGLGGDEPAGRASDKSKRRRALCGVTCDCGPNREPVACAYKPRHTGPHSWATLPTFPLHADTVVNELGRVMQQHYGGFVNVPAPAREVLSFCIETFKSDPNARSV